MLKDALLIYVFKLRLRGHCQRSGQHVAAEQMLIVWKAQRERCAGCNSRFDDVTFEIDHKIPVRLGGATEQNNMQFLCRPCHNEKTRLEQTRWHRTNWEKQRDADSLVRRS